MKRIKYRFAGFEKRLPYSEKTEEIARREADNGEYEIYDDCKLELVKQPAVEERLSALETAMLEIMGVTAGG